MEACFGLRAVRSGFLKGSNLGDAFAAWLVLAWLVLAWLLLEDRGVGAGASGAADAADASGGDLLSAHALELQQLSVT